jgi:hypothetical protein
VVDEGVLDGNEDALEDVDNVGVVSVLVAWLPSLAETKSWATPAAM